MVSWREQPTRFDIEAVQANTRRVGLVIRIRWALLIVLVVYSAMAGLAYTASISIGELAQRMLIPAMAMLFVVVYNGFYQFNYKRLGNIAVWNQLQLALDAIVVSVLVYYSGGVSSWFWSMYSLFILEAAFILPKRRDAWMLAGLCVALLGAIEWLEFLRILPHVFIPFATAEQFRDPVYVSVRYLWQLAVLAGTAAVATQLVGEQRAAEEHRQSLVVLDETTALYSRGFFLRALPAEVRRAQRDHRALHVILLDIDHFGLFNRRFGIEAGDTLLRLIAGAITRGVSEVGDITVTTNLAARFGGEEFVVMLAEDERIDGAPQAADALHLAEKLRVAIAATTHAGAGVTVSVGVASMPGDGVDADQLLDAADAALSVAIERGGDRVVVAQSLVSDNLEAEIAAEAAHDDGGADDDRYPDLDASDFRSLDD
jgi:diguanylate cyclase (GGDEF)-like protein